MIEPVASATFDTNIAVYAIATDPKAAVAAEIVASCTFVSIQVLNEYANVASRKLGRNWPTIAADIVKLCSANPTIFPVGADAHHDARRIAERYRLSFYDSLMIAVTMGAGARTLYSEDMQHGLVIDDTLRIVDPFR